MEVLGEIEIREVDESRIEQANLENPGFGRIFSDHMLEMKYEEGHWQPPVVKPYGPVEITPALSTLHYAQSVFEGTKAYYVDEKTVHLFRPEMNAERMINSCERMCIPPVSREVFLDGIRTLIKLDKDWIPQNEGGSLYIRPFACAWDHIVAAQASKAYRFYIITSPVGAYYSKPVSLATSEHYVRAVKGGTGETKTAGNYARSLLPTRKVNNRGYDQVLWLDAFEHQYIEEVGTMNIFFLIDGVLVTSPLTGTILPGVTRDSVIQLAQHWGIPVEERPLAIDEVMQAAREGNLQEVFGAGTATVITPVKSITHQDETIEPYEQSRGPLGQKLYDTIYGIQTGKVGDPFGWIEPVKV